MLERIIEKSKNLIKSVKRPFTATFAGLTLLWTVSACELPTTRPDTWEIESRTERIEERGTSQKSYIKYNIQNLTINGYVVEIPISKTAIEETYKNSILIERVLEKGYVTGTRCRYRTETRYSTFMGRAKFDKEYIEIPGSEYKYKEPTGDTRVRELQKDLQSKLIRTEKTEGSAQNIGVEILSSSIFESNRKTDSFGLFRLLIRPEFQKNFDFNKENLKRKIRDSDVLESVKEPIKSQLLPLILDYIESKKYTINVKTIEQSTEFKNITNDEKTFAILGFSVDENNIYLILKSFIDKKINSKIKETTVTVQDRNSHVEIPDVKLEMEIDAPDRRDLADDYFTGKLLEWAISQIKTYETGKSSRYTDRQGTVMFNVYIPSKFKFETKHSKYHAFEKSTDFKENNLTKTARLTDIGQKIRTEEVEKGGGDLIEK